MVVGPSQVAVSRLIILRYYGKTTSNNNMNYFYSNVSNRACDLRHRYQVSYRKTTSTGNNLLFKYQ